jgi:hypothetical protein
MSAAATSRLGRCVSLTAFGISPLALHVNEHTVAAVPKAGEALVRMTMCPVNPADLFRCVSGPDNIRERA